MGSCGYRVYQWDWFCYCLVFGLGWGLCGYQQLEVVECGLGCGLVVEGGIECGRYCVLCGEG